MNNFLYKIYYGEELVYFGRTHQKLEDRIRAHMFNPDKINSRIKKLNINMVSKIEFTNCNSEADMFLYEIYYINKYKPKFNTDDKASDKLSVKLDELLFEKWDTPLWESWKNKINIKEEKRENDLKFSSNICAEKQKLEIMKEAGELDTEEYDKRSQEIKIKEIEKKYNEKKITLEEYLRETGQTRL